MNHKYQLKMLVQNIVNLWVCNLIKQIFRNTNKSIMKLIHGILIKFLLNLQVAEAIHQICNPPKKQQPTKVTNFCLYFK